MTRNLIHEYMGNIFCLSFEEIYSEKRVTEKWVFPEERLTKYKRNVKKRKKKVERMTNMSNKLREI